MTNYGGEFPTDHTELIKLKGVGPYTARAIGSFAFDNPVGVIDGNVLRVMSRVLGDASPINQQKTRKHFQTLIDTWVAGVDSRAFNHGIMDIGATICTPTKPGCLICPLTADCVARDKGLTDVLPYKEKKLKRKVRYFHFYLIENEEDHIYIRQRPKSGLWGGLWEIPNQEVSYEQWESRTSTHPEVAYQMAMKHVFTHFDMMIQVFSTSGKVPALLVDGQFISKDKISIFAFSRAVLKIFDQLLS